MEKVKYLSFFHHRFLLAAFLALNFFNFSFAQNVLVLTDSSENYPLALVLGIYLDSKNSLTIEDILRMDDKNMFQKIPGESNNLGYVDETIWLKFYVENKSKQYKWLLNFNYAPIDEVFFYSIDGNTILNFDKAGLNIPFKSRSIHHRHIVFPVKLKNEKQITFFIQVKSGKSIPLNLQLETEKEFFKSDSVKILILGIFYGGMILMTLYNLFLFFSIKDLSFLLYSFYAICVGLYQSTIDGFFNFIILSDTKFASIYIQVASVWLLYLSGILFTREFLQIKKYSKYLNLLPLLFITFNIILTIISLTGNMYKTKITATTGAIYIGLMFISGIYTLIKGNKTAKYYLVATMFFLSGAFLRMIKNLGVIDASILTDYAVPYGLLAEMAILSFALGNRINETKRNEEREKALIRSRIASDLHDEIGSNLSSISVASQLLSKSKSLNENEKVQLDDITITAKESAVSIRDIIWFINPTNDNPVDILLKMKETASKMLQEIKYNFICNDCNILKERDIGLRRNLFLIYKEILNNIVKHSGAKNVTIDIFEKSKNIILEIEDDGIGFDSGKISGDGQGLKNIVRRAESLGGNATVTGSNPSGTKWRVII